MAIVNWPPASADCYLLFGRSGEFGAGWRKSGHKAMAFRIATKNDYPRRGLIDPARYRKENLFCPRRKFVFSPRCD